MRQAAEAMARQPMDRLSAGEAHFAPPPARTGEETER
jgi:hypothetical protein